MECLTEKEVGVLPDRLVVPLAAVCGEGVAVKLAARHTICYRLHRREECAVEVVVVAICGEEVVAGQRSIALELIVAVETGLATEYWK